MREYRIMKTLVDGLFYSQVREVNYRLKIGSLRLLPKKSRWVRIFELKYNDSAKNNFSLLSSHNYSCGHSFDDAEAIIKNYELTFLCEIPPQEYIKYNEEDIRFKIELKRVRKNEPEPKYIP